MRKVKEIHDPEDEGTMTLYNVGNYLPVYVV
jgi:hypothetical protein